MGFAIAPHCPISIAQKVRGVKCFFEKLGEKSPIFSIFRLSLGN
jgi:hypothetical protein